MRRFVTLALAALAAVAPVSAAHTASGCVKDEKGAGIPGAVIRISELEGPLRVTATADARGCWRQAGLPDAAYEIRAEVNGVTLDRKQIVLDEGKRNATVDLHYHPAAKSAAAAEAAPPIINLKMLAAGGPSRPEPVRSESARSALLESLSFDPSPVDGGAPVMAKVILRKPAPAEGLLLRISLSNSVLAVAPEQITIAPGEKQSSFPVKTTRLRGPADILLRITADDGEGTLTGFLEIRSYTRITLRMGGDGTGTVVSRPTGIRCTRGVCAQPFRDGEEVQLVPQPDAGSAFRSWAGDCGQDGTVLVSGPMRCTATFVRQ